MCIKCELTFSHSVELNIHTRTFHQESEVIQFNCTECSQEERTEEAIVNRIETKHSTILSPAKISQSGPPPRSEKHNATKYHCTECSQEEKTEENIVKHIETKH